MESIVSAVCLGGGVVVMLIALALTIRLQARTPRIKDDELRPSDTAEH